MKKSREDKVINQFALSNFSLRNRITVVLILFMLVVLGVSAYNNLPKESYPEVEQSTVLVGTPYPGNSPTDIENLITRPIEKEINTISEVKEIRSTSIQGYSTIVAEFDSGTDIEYAKSKVKIEKFIQEVFWRTYWKGWLEGRSKVWENYKKDIKSLKELHSFGIKKKYIFQQ